MFVSVIHPRDEPLDKSFQCLRYTPPLPVSYTLH